MTFLDWTLLGFLATGLYLLGLHWSSRRVVEHRSPFAMPEVLRAAQEGSRAISAALKVRGN